MTVGRDRPRIILDCDPGVDDMFAIFCALRYTDLVAVTTVAGNVSVDHTTRNALAVLELASAPQIPVHRGSAGPLNGTPLRDAAHVHGESGLGGVVLAPVTTAVASNDAVQALLDISADDEVTVVAIGPLTNIALAIQRDPGWSDRVRRLVIMGGSTTSGNVGPFSEFNIAVDPEAAKVVFDSGIEPTMAGLNLTRQVTMGPNEIATLRDAGTPTAMASAEALDFYSDFSLAHYGVKASAMHDPCAVVEVVRPDVFERQRMRVDVETAGDHTRGMTVCDQRANSLPANADVLMAADRKQIVEIILAAAIDPTY